MLEMDKAKIQVQNRYHCRIFRHFEDLNGAFTAGRPDDLFRLDFYRISIKNQVLDWL